MNRSEKAAIIEQVRSRASVASLAVVADFKGMTVEEMTSLRGKLREAGAEFVVVKNTLARLAFTDTKHAVIKDNFKENCAVALGFEDPVALAKAITEFAKTSKIFKLRHACLDGKAMTVAQLEALAKLPSREVLLGQLLGTMNAVPTSFVSLLANTIRPILYVLKAIEEKKAA